MRLIDEQYLKTPAYGSRSMARHFRRQGRKVNRKRIQRLMRLMGIEAIYLHSFGCGTDLRQGLTEWVRFYNHERGHSSLDDRTPDEVYYGLPHPFAEAA
jgi:putative transposase